MFAKLVIIAWLSAMVFSIQRLPAYTRGVYILLSDPTISLKNSEALIPTTGPWEPVIGSWVKQFNVVFFTFIGPDMNVPPAFEYARFNGQFANGTKIIFAISGYSRSSDLQWQQTFTTPDAAKALALKVSMWKCDGIDLDWEKPIGDDASVAVNIGIFVKTLRAFRPDFIITQPVYGTPQVYS